MQTVFFIISVSTTRRAQQLQYGLLVTIPCTLQSRALKINASTPVHYKTTHLGKRTRSSAPATLHDAPKATKKTKNGNLSTKTKIVECKELLPSRLNNMVCGEDVTTGQFVSKSSWGSAGGDVSPDVTPRDSYDDCLSLRISCAPSPDGGEPGSESRASLKLPSDLLVVTRRLTLE